jgi:hypothetical protein
MAILTEAISKKVSSFFGLTNRYCLYVKLMEPRRTKKVALFIEGFITLQVLSILIPMDVNEGLPWNYSNLGWVWAVGHIAVRIDSLITFLSSTHSAVAILMATVLAALVLSLYLVAAPIFSSTNLEFDELLRKRAHQSHSRVKLHCCIRTIAVEMLLIPLTFGTLRTTKGSPDNSADHSQLFILLFVAYIPFVLIHVLSLVRINWSEGFASISSPVLNLGRTAHLFGLALVTSMMRYADSPLLFSAVLLLIGLSYFVFIGLRRPYFKRQLNYLCLVQGCLVIYSSCCIVVTGLIHIESPREGFTSILFFVPLGPMLYLVYALMEYLEARALRAHAVSSAYSLEFLLRDKAEKAENVPEGERVAIEPDGKINQLITDSLAKYKQDPLMLIWIIHYCMLGKDLVFLKKTLASLARFKQNWLFKHQVAYTNHIAIDWLHSFPHESEPYNFAVFKDQLQDILRMDEDATMTTLEFYEELSKSRPQFTRLERLAMEMRQKMKVCKANYKSIMKAHSKDTVILEYYAGYLAAVESSNKAEEYANLVLKKKNEDKRLSIRSSKAVDLNYFDMNNCIFIVSLEGESQGLVTWVHNADILGYTQFELLNSNFNQLVPPSIAFDIKTDATQMAFDSISPSVFLHKNHTLVNGWVRCSLINETDGSLTVLFYLKPSYEPESEYALVDNAYSTLHYQVSPM